MSRCTACKKRTTNTFSGCYDLDCVTCCARLLISARPHGSQQRGMMEVIQKNKEAPGKDAIVNEIKRIDAV